MNWELFSKYLPSVILILGFCLSGWLSKKRHEGLLRAQSDNFEERLKQDKKHHDALQQIQNNYSTALEDFKSLHQLELENHKSRLSFRVIAVEKRLEVYQQAYWLSQKMNLAAVTTDGEKFERIYSEVSKWWYQNCLYLSPQLFKAFRDGMFFCEILHENLSKKHLHEKQYFDASKALTDLPKLIQESVDLPNITLEDIRENSKARAQEELD